MRESNCDELADQYTEQVQQIEGYEEFMKEGITSDTQ